MHVARIRHLFYPEMPRDYFYELSARQAEAGHSVDVLTWSRDKECLQIKVPEGFTINTLPGVNVSFPGLPQEYPFLPGLPDKLRRLKPDIIHGESHLFLPTFQAVLQAKKLNLPSIVTVHGVFVERNGFLNFAQKAYIRTFGSKLFKNADRIVCLTQQDVNAISKLGCPAEKIVLIPNAVDTFLFKPSKERRENLVVWVGRFVPEKGVKYLVEAAKMIVQSSPDTEFLLIGYGPLKDRIMKLALHNGLSERTLKFGGKLTRTEIAGLLSIASVFVIPSLSEGMPIALMEAMASGAPVVGSDIPGVSNLVEEGVTGLLVSPRDPVSLASAISELLNDSKKSRSMGNAARNTIVQAYSWSHIMGKMDKLYQEVAD
jgi:glycosyltransferase involved in cell wall biosynthesis